MNVCGIVVERHCPCDTVSTGNLTWTGMGSSPSVSGKRPATIRLGPNTIPGLQTNALRVTEFNLARFTLEWILLPGQALGAVIMACCANRVVLTPYEKRNCVTWERNLMLPPPPRASTFTSDTYIYGHSTFTKDGGIHVLSFTGGSMEYSSAFMGVYLNPSSYCEFFSPRIFN